MTVYVDDMFKYPMGQFRHMKMSHMIADAEEELHEMAAKIGVSRRWYQGDHYDICLSKRAKAIKSGAVEISMHDLAAMAMLRRWGHDMGDPASARRRLAAIKMVTNNQ